MEEIAGSKEVTPLKSIDTLYVLIHPLWTTKPDHQEPEAIKRFTKEREAMASAMQERTIPRSETEVTVFIPHVQPGYHRLLARGSLARNLRETKSAVSTDFLQWPKLYRDLREASPHSRNVLIGPNLVGTSRWSGIGEDEFDQFLRKKGYQITDLTKVIVGGEMLFPCVLDSIMALMKHPLIDKLRVDTKATLSSGYLFNNHPDLEVVEKQRFEEYLERAGFNVSQEGDYIAVSEPAKSNGR